MRTTIYDPFATIRRLQDEMNRAVGGAITAADDNSTSAVAEWAPTVDVHEFADRFEITADVPGVDPNEIEITMENGVLSISGSRVTERSDDSDATARRRERSYGSFYRRFTLPDTADEERVAARSNHGVLEITLPKKAQPQPKKISVSH